ncbi:MAG: hypothetical protein WDO17_16130 [Alphaproteobacteria bacterium]
MHTKLTLGLAAVFMSVAVPAGAYWWSKPADNQFNETLRGFGYRPLSLPTSEMSVGAIYSVDSRARYFDVVCDVDTAELTGAVKRTTSPEIEAYMQTDRHFESNVKVDLGFLANGNGKMSAKQTVHFSLTDIVVESISHEKSVDLFISMAERPSCGRAIAEALSSGGYVCQGLKVLEATAEYKLDQDTLSKIDAKASKGDVNSIVKLAVEAQSGTEVVERQGKVQSGKKLKYAVAMKPTCMAPPTARFHRVLPDSAFGRWTNYVLFNLIEPLWPNKDEQIRSAEAPVQLAVVE